MVKYQRHHEGGTEQIEEAEDIPVVEAIPPPRKCFGDGFKVLVLGIIIFCVAITIGLVVDIYYLRGKSGTGGVVTSSPVCTKVAAEILKQNNNPVDAGVAALLCLTVVSPDQCSLAGSAFILVRKNGAEKFLNLQFGVPTNSSDKPNDMVAIPRFLAGLKKASTDFGTLPFSQLVQPSLDLATKGFPITNSTAAFIKALPDKMNKYFLTNGVIPRAGESVLFPLVATTLKRLIDGKYSLGNDLQKSTEGKISSEEYFQYQNSIAWENPLSVTIRGGRVVSSGPPSSGLFMLFALNILNQFDAQDANVTAMVLKIVQENGLKDLKSRLMQEELIDTLLNVSLAKSYASRIRLGWNDASESISNSSTDATASEVSSATVSVVNREGDAVSAVCSLGSVMGAKTITSEGITLNNGLAFLTPETKNRIVTSLASPTFVVDDEVVSSFNTSPDSEGLQSLIQVVDNLLIKKLSVLESVTYPRLALDNQKNLLVESKRFSKYGTENVVWSLKTVFPGVVEKNTLGVVDVASNSHVSDTVKDLRRSTEPPLHGNS